MREARLRNLCNMAFSPYDLKHEVFWKEQNLLCIPKTRRSLIWSFKVCAARQAASSQGSQQYLARHELAKSASQSIGLHF